MESRNPEGIMASNSSLNTLLGNPLFFSQILIRTTQSLKYPRNQTSFLYSRSRPEVLTKRGRTLPHPVDGVHQI